MVDYLIVGQGLAGTLLSYYLHKNKASFAIVDPSHHKASSKVAAGIINPITGRRFVKSWRMDELLPFAKACYAELSELLGFEVFEEKQVSMLFRLPETENNWLARATDPAVQDYIAPTFNLPAYQRIFGEVLGGVEYQQSGRAKLPQLIEGWKAFLLQEQVPYLEEQLDYAALQVGEEGVAYKGLKARHLVFCEGARARFNPFFSYLPFNPAKGEVLLVQIPDYPFEGKMVKDGIFIVPWQDDLYWVGSSYDRNFEHEEPTETERFELLGHLSRMMKLPFQQVAHWAAVRPTVRDRRPFLGTHPEHERLHVFNGLGAKGSYLGPFFARQMVDYLLHQHPLEKEVDIQRCLKFY